MEGEENQNQEPSTTQEVSTPKKSNMLPVVVIALVLIFGGAYLYKSMKGGSASQPTPTSTPAEVVSATEAPVASATPSGPVKEFTIDGSNFKFSPTTINVAKGTNVKITFKDDDGMHNLVVDGYDVQTDTIKSGESASVTFVADKAGTFEYYCSVDSHKEKGMTGKLIVK